MDFRPIPLAAVRGQIEAQTHRRFLKAHLPIDALVFSPKAKYLYIGRDGRDVAWSLYHHHAGFTPGAYAMMNNAPGRVGPPLEPPNPDIVAYFHEWLGGGGIAVGGSFWEHVQGWWDARQLPNVRLLHFNHLKADLPGEMRRIAKFLGIAIDEPRLPQMVAHCGIDYMRNVAAEQSPILKDVFGDGATTFFNKGTNGRWKDALLAADLDAYDQAVKANLTPECARWMATGEIAA